jgi:hypothetical protein
MHSSVIISAMAGPVQALSVCATRSFSAQHRGCHELGDITAQAGNLAHEGAADELVLVRRRHEHRLDLGHQLAVHAGHLELVLEVADRAQAAHHDLAAVGDHEVAQQAAEGVTSTLA